MRAHGPDPRREVADRVVARARQHAREEGDQHLAIVRALLVAADAFDRHQVGIRPFVTRRAVFVVDAAGCVRYREIVPEITSEPDYEAALNVLFDLV